MVNIKCDICNSLEKDFLFTTMDYNWSGDGPFNIVKCKNCDFIYLSPRPDGVELLKYYPDIYYDNAKYINLHHEMRMVGRKFKPGRVLDVGCGKGFFLNQMKELGWLVKGVELSKEEADFAKKNFDIEVYVKKFSDLSLPENYFDLVTFWHSLEHMEAPLFVLKQVYKVLRTNGYLFISIPNISSLQAKLFGEKWYHIDAPRHIDFFSEKTLRLFLEKSGFSIKETSYSAFGHNLFGWMMSFINLLKLNHSHLKKRKTCVSIYIAHLSSKFLKLLLCILISPIAFIEGLFSFSGTLEVLAIKEEK